MCRPILSLSLYCYSCVVIVIVHVTIVLLIALFIAAFATNLIHLLTYLLIYLIHGLTVHDRHQFRSYTLILSSGIPFYCHSHSLEIGITCQNSI